MAMKPENLALNRSIVKLRAVVPDDAFTAAILGTERVGNGIVINSDGLILTMGYLITEATDVWLTVDSGQEVAGHALAYDQVTGFGLVVALERLDMAPLTLGSSAAIHRGDRAHVVSYPEFARRHDVQVLARRDFAGAWEYLLEDAIFTAPAHPHWSGAALIDARGELVGLGSLLVRETIGDEEANANMFVPTDLLKPILTDLVERGRGRRPPRPWLGVYAVEVAGRVYVTGVAEGGPAQRADVREGDVIAEVGTRTVSTLAGFYNSVWSLGTAGIVVPLTTIRGGTSLHVNLRSVDRNDLLKKPQAH